MADKIGKERIRSACIQCQKRKKRCDGGKPSCANCSKSKASCQYTERRPRGPGKKNNRVDHLETRLKTLESALRIRESTSTSVSDSQAPEFVQPVQLQASEVDTTGISPPYNHSALVEPPEDHAVGSGVNQVGLETNRPAETILNPLSANFERQQTASPAEIISRFSEFTDGIKSAYQWIRGQENRGLSQGMVFARLPTYDQVRSLVEPIVEHLQQHGVAITSESWVKLLDDQYSADPDRFTDDPTRWALVNSFFATAMLNRSTTDFLAEILPTAWSYFKNAFSMFPDLITQGKDVSACEALAGMAMFAQRSADAQLIAQITAALTCLIKTLGLHRKRFYLSLDQAAVQRHHRIFWVAYILEVDAMEKYDISPSLGNEELGAPFEHDDSAAERTNPQELSWLDLLRWRAELAVIQRRIYERLHHIKAHPVERDELLDTVASMDKQLQGWKSSLPGNTWAVDKHTDESDFDSSIAVLQCAFYNSMSKIHMAVVSVRAAEQSRKSLRGEDLALETSHFDSEIRKAWNTSVVSARNMIAVVVNLASQPFFQLWGTLCYPLSAVLTLFLDILQSPATPAAQDNLRRIGHFVTFLEKLAGGGCDVQRLLDACIQLHEVASCAISTSQVGGQPQSQRLALGRSITLSQLELIRAKLSKVQDWLQLAQGLLSNLPLLRAEAEEVLSGISGFGMPQGMYGLCVPDLLKSQN